MRRAMRRAMRTVTSVVRRAGLVWWPVATVLVLAHLGLAVLAINIVARVILQRGRRVSR